MAHVFLPGQRWISEREPELGLGRVLRLSPRTVTLTFGACGEIREYGLDTTPLRRVRFHPGDTIQLRGAGPRVVGSVLEEEGCLTYVCDGEAHPEADLADTISLDKPKERLLAGQVDGPEAFDLRVEALKVQLRRAKSPVRGFAGGRIDLLPHQLSVASEVAGRLAPRVLLADEVGLGKTIEAGLILHRLLATGRVGRVLILVPDALLHQWFVELLRRFNLWFAIFDEARCAALEEEGANPFLDDQLVLASLDFLVASPERQAQALEAGWDLLVVDEAHHLGWTPEAVSPGYALVESLGRQTQGLLLLTATPEQLGMASHYARLRLLDPDRFPDLEAFLAEAESFREVAQLAGKILEGRILTAADEKDLAKILGESPAQVKARLEALADGDRTPLLNALLDLHGTGRVMFRNTRHTVTGFPGRRAHLVPLAGTPALKKALAREWAADLDPDAPFQPDFAEDPRLDWLADHLRALGTAKVLVICRTRRKAEAVHAALQTRLQVKAAVFHEGQTLVQRDRGAAWFADPNGARLLICSEIGSEGRNFQFAHQMVLFDLPLDPSLLEQRLGRLDRIGQTSQIQVHVPFVPGTGQEVLARWYHEGLGAFETSLAGGRELLEAFGEQLRTLGARPTAAGLKTLLKASQTARAALAERLEAGRDRLLELSSCRPEAAEALVREIRALDADRGLDAFLVASLEAAGVPVEEVAPRTWQLGSAGVLVDAFPGLPAEGLTATWDRARALAREDLQFLTLDHPLLTGALDLILGTERGNSCFARWPDATESGLYLEAIYVLEATAPPALHADRFLPPTPLRVVVDHLGQDLGKALPRTAYAKHLQAVDGQTLLEQPEFRDRVLPKLLRMAHKLADRQAVTHLARARAALAVRLDPERARLCDLQRVNPAVRAEEIALLDDQRRDLDTALQAARPRLDALRLIHRG